MTEQDAVLGRLLAFTDAVWKPLRDADWGRPTPTVLYEYREQFASAGVPWHSGEKSEAGRKADQRTLEALASAGLLTLHGRERRASARLTDQGDLHARALAGLPSIDAAHFVIREVIRLESSGDGFGPMAAEIWVAGVKSTDSERSRLKLIELVDEAKPALCRGWLETESDCYGRVYYVATDQGRKIAKGPEPELPAGLPAMDEDAADLYDREVVAFRDRLRHAEPEDSGQIGFLPVPASLDIRPKRKRKQRSKT
jgi:hypothetical protein